MRRLLLSMLGGLLACIFLTVSLQAQSIQLDLGKIDPELAAKVLQATKKPETASPVASAAQAKEWADIGENVAKAIAATAKALSVEVNQFLTTPVGKWTFIFLFWYLMGKKIWMIVGGIMMWIAIVSILWRSFRIFHMPKEVIGEILPDGTRKFRTETYEFRSNEAKTASACFHAGFFAVFTIAALLVIF